MRPEILALFIPIIFVAGLFTAISLHIYYKYKAKVATAEHAKGESMEAWCKAEAMARAAVSRSAALRTGGLLAGAGTGTAAGMFIGGAPEMWTFFGSMWQYHDRTGGQMVMYAIFIGACAMIAGGVCMAGMYFWDRALEKKK